MKGVRTLPNGTRRVQITINGRQHSKHFPKGTLDSELKEWRKRTEAETRYGIAPVSDRTFAEDCAEYTLLCQSMPTADNQAYYISRWKEVFGDRVRSSITPVEIQIVLEGWKKKGKVDGGGYSHAMLNRLRSALMGLYTKLDVGTNRVNVVKLFKPYDEGDAKQKWRARDTREWYRWLARMEKGCHTRARLRLMLWTGWPHAQIKKLTPADVDLAGRKVWVSRRRKGGGHPAVSLPLLPQAVTALAAFVKVGAWGKFSNSAMHSMLHRAWEKENVWRAKWGHAPLPPVRPYDARHTFGTRIAMEKDDRITMKLMLHGTMAQTQRYTDEATNPRLLAVLDAVAARLTKAPPVKQDGPHEPAPQPATASSASSASVQGTLEPVKAGQGRLASKLRIVKSAKDFAKSG